MVNKLFLVLLFLMCVVILIFILSSVKYIEQNEYGVIKNKLTQNFNKQILIQGIYFFPMWKELIKFQRTMLNKDLSDLELLTKDKIKIVAHVSIQYQYEKDKLISIVLSQFGNNEKYLEYLESLMRSEIFNSFLKFYAIDFYENRSVVNNKLRDDLILFFDEHNIGSSIKFVQLIDINLPEEYIDIQHEKQNARQGLQTTKNNKETEIIKANTYKLESLKNCDVILMNAKNYENGTLYNAEQNKEIIDVKWKTKTNVYKELSNKINLGSEDILNFIKSEIVSTSKIYSSIDL